ncbi:hypothetical protein EIP91_002627 [Steccherinum ochraceum]|uniref:Carboxymuconolactone decarboxylase-like domain-containing protein n=1 Tax=Steccherinum ochraceum TaxID=92696 RepID=A0A4V2MXL4_9APHY|nr:hypothetical protein EIP91_002627 [Steccherinum ochraceum]
MAQIATSKFIAHLQSLYPNGEQSVVQSRWYLLAVVAFSASNLPDAIPLVFQYALEELKREGARKEADMHRDQIALARRFREAIFRGGMLTGYARAINSLVALHEAMPDDLKDTQTLRSAFTLLHIKPGKRVKNTDTVALRDTELSMQEYSENGRKLFESMYGDNAQSVQGLLDNIHPDMGWFSNTIAYGIVYGAPGVLTPIEVSFVMGAANVAMECPKQAGWHLDNSLRAGASPQEVAAVRNTATDVLKAAKGLSREDAF